MQLQLLNFDVQTSCLNLLFTACCCCWPGQVSRCAPSPVLTHLHASAEPSQLQRLTNSTRLVLRRSWRTSWPCKWWAPGPSTWTARLCPQRRCRPRQQCCGSRHSSLVRTWCGRLGMVWCNSVQVKAAYVGWAVCTQLSSCRCASCLYMLIAPSMPCH